MLSVQEVSLSICHRQSICLVPKCPRAKCPVPSDRTVISWTTSCCCDRKCKHIIVKSTWNEVKKYSFSRTAYLNVLRKCRLKRVCSIAQKMAIVGERRRDTAKDAKRQAKDVKSQWKRGKATRNYEVGGNTTQEYTATPLPRIFAKTNRFRNSFVIL